MNILLVDFYFYTSGQLIGQIILSFYLFSPLDCWYISFIVEQHVDQIKKKANVWQ